MLNSIALSSLKRVRFAMPAAVLLALLVPATAQQVQVKLDPAKTHIDWTLGDVLHTVQGTFQLKSGTIVFDQKTGDASGQVVVDAASGNSGNGTRDSKMKKEILETARYPDIVFVPKHVTGFVAGQESSTVQVAGDFTIHGGTHELTLTVPIVSKDATVEAHTMFDVPYVDWGMKNPSTLFLKVEKTVQINISAVGELQPAVASHPLTSEPAYPTLTARRASASDSLQKAPELCKSATTRSAASTNT